jgi:uncharacterized membrane protein (UPF0136 family)
VNKKITKNRPWHLWLINITALLFFGVGTYDFINIAMQNMNYLTSQYSPTGVEYFTNYPFPLLCLFGFNLLTGVAGIIIALFNTGWASKLILTSGIANFILIFITVIFLNRVKNIGLSMTLQDTTVMLATFGLYLYYRRLSSHRFKKS